MYMDLSLNSELPILSHALLICSFANTTFNVFDIIFYIFLLCVSLDYLLWI